MTQTGSTAAKADGVDLPSSEPIRASLVEIAAREFAQHGFAGAKLERIAAEAGITRAMIYYYFGGREGVYLAVLEDAYNAIWQAEHAVDIRGLAPEHALRRLVEFRIDYYIDHPTFVALVSIENRLQAQYIKRARTPSVSSLPSLQQTANVLALGQAQGVFRADIDPLDVYRVIVSLGFFNVANGPTFGTIFGLDVADRSRMRRLAVDVALRYVLNPHSK